MTGITEGRIMHDKIENICTDSIIQHGKYNDRIYLMKLGQSDIGEVLQAIKNLVNEHSYSKIFVKVPIYISPQFQADGFFVEAIIPDFYSGTTSCCFMAKFLNSDRLMNIETTRLQEFSELLKVSHKNISASRKEKYVIKILDSSHVDKITELYKETFITYPFPIFNADYINMLMKNNQAEFFGAFDKDKLIVVSSAEIDKSGLNAEMTDFATHKDYRGQKLSIQLLRKMEKAVKNYGIKTVYSIARLNSIAINKTFINQQYKYAGTLIKNTNISGSIESMNVWYKYL